MLSAEQLEQRKQFIGASEISAILGLTPKWRTAWDVWAEKTNRIDPAKVKESEAAGYGNLFEPVILDWAAPRAVPEGHKGIIQRNVTVTRQGTRLAATLDSLLEIIKPHDLSSMGQQVGRVPIEAKYSSMEEAWGESGTNDVPIYYNVQLHAQMQILGPDVREGFIALMLPGYRSIDMRLYRIERDDKAAQQTQDAADEFWDKYVATDTPPPDCLPSVETLKALKRQSKVIEFDPETQKIVDGEITAYLRGKDVEKEAKQFVEDQYRQVVARFGDGDALKCAYGVATYNEVNNKGYTSVVEPFSYRRLNIPQPKKAKK